MKEFVSTKIKIKSSQSTFPEQILTATETHFIPEHISFYVDFLLSNLQVQNAND